MSNVAAHRREAARHHLVAVGECALDQRFLREQRFQLAPQRDAFEQVPF